MPQATELINTTVLTIATVSVRDESSRLNMLWLYSIDAFGPRWASCFNPCLRHRKLTANPPVARQYTDGCADLTEPVADT